MANNLQNTSGKSPRRDKSKSLRQTVIQVRMNDEEIALLDNKRGTESRSRFLRHALYDDAAKQSESVTSYVPDIERMVMALNRLGVNVNQIARRCNTEAKNARPWSTTSKQMCTSEEMKILEACQQELHDTKDELVRLQESVQKQSAIIQMSTLPVGTRMWLERHMGSDDFYERINEVLDGEPIYEHEVGGDV